MVKEKAQIKAKMVAVEAKAQATKKAKKA